MRGSACPGPRAASPTRGGLCGWHRRRYNGAAGRVAGGMVHKGTGRRDAVLGTVGHGQRCPSGRLGLSSARSCGVGVSVLCRWARAVSGWILVAVAKPAIHLDSGLALRECQGWRSTGAVDTKEVRGVKGGHMAGGAHPVLLSCAPSRGSRFLGRLSWCPPPLPPFGCRRCAGAAPGRRCPGFSSPLLWLGSAGTVHRAHQLLLGGKQIS